MKETMGQIIKRLRKERGFTQEELAEQVGVTFQAISKWENDTGMPDISQVIPLATVFDVSTDVLFGRYGVNDNEEVFALIRHARSLVDGLTSVQSLRQCYDALHEGLKTYPNNMALLMQCLEAGIALSYPENDCYDAERGADIYKSCIREADLVIKYGNNTTDVLRAHMIMVLLHAAYGNAEAAKTHAEHFPWRSDMTIHKMNAYISHFETDYEAKAKHCQTDYMYHFEAMLDDIVELSGCYDALGNTTDAISVLKQAIVPIDSTAYGTDVRPHFHYREQGDIYALIAKLYLKTGDENSALEQLAKMVDYDIAASKIKPDAKVDSPLLRSVDYNFYWLPPNVGERLRKKLNNPTFESLHNHPMFEELLVKAKNI